MLKELIHAFKDVAINDNINFEVIDWRGQKEDGQGAGVVRDVYTSFWKEILDTHFLGDQERVPLIVHDFYVDEWTNIGKILVKGFKDCGYFPLNLSKAFIINCLFNDVPNEILLESFLKYIPKMESTVADIALKAGGSSTVFDDETFLDFLDRYGCRTRVTCSNVYGVMVELARQELIQKPYLMVCTWKQSLSSIKESFPSIQSITDLFAKAIPDNRKVIKLLEADPRNKAERDVFDYLREYVMGLEMGMLKKFLKFTTGADMILIEKIKISFVVFSNDVLRRPIAHTCAPMMELSSAYKSFPDFREELNNVLSANEWGMDFV